MGRSRAGAERTYNHTAFASLPRDSHTADEKNFIEWAQSHDHDDLLRYSMPDINRTAVKDAIRSGWYIPGAQLVRTKSLIIK